MSVEAGAVAPKPPLPERVANGVISISNFLPKSAEPIHGDRRLVVAQFITDAFAEHATEYNIGVSDRPMAVTAARLLSDTCDTSGRVEPLTDDVDTVIGALHVFSFALARARHIKAPALLGPTLLRKKVDDRYREAHLVSPNFGEVQTKMTADSEMSLDEQDAVLWQVFGFHPARLAETFRDGPKEGWIDLANCKSVDPDELFVMGEAQNGVIESICKGCPVRPDCAVDAVNIEEEFGVRSSTERGRRRATDIIGADPKKWAKGALYREVRRQRASARIRDAVEAKQSGNESHGSVLAQSRNN